MTEEEVRMMEEVEGAHMTEGVEEAHRLVGVERTLEEEEERTSEGEEVAGTWEEEVVASTWEAAERRTALAEGHILVTEHRIPQRAKERRHSHQELRHHNRPQVGLLRHSFSH